MEGDGHPRTMKTKRSLRMLTKIGNSMMFTQKLRMVFEMLDVHGIGYITLSDLRENDDLRIMLQECGINLDQKIFAIVDFFRTLDRESSGEVHLPGFINGVSQNVNLLVRSEGTQALMKELVLKLASVEGMLKMNFDLGEKELGNDTIRLKAFSMYIERELKIHQSEPVLTPSKEKVYRNDDLSYSIFCSIVRKGVASAVNEALQAAEMMGNSEGLKTEVHEGKEPGAKKWWAIRRKTELKRKDYGGAVKMMPDGNLIRNRQTETTDFVWAKHPSLADAKEDDYEDAIISSQTTDFEPNSALPLSAVKNLKPLITQSDLEAFSQDNLSALEVAQLEVLQKSIAAFLQRKPISVSVGNETSVNINSTNINSNMTSKEIYGLTCDDAAHGFKEPVDDSVIVTPGTNILVSSLSNDETGTGSLVPTSTEQILARKILEYQRNNRSLRRLCELHNINPEYHIVDDGSSHPDTEIGRVKETVVIPESDGGSDPLVPASIVEKRLSYRSKESLLHDVDSTLAELKALIAERNASVGKFVQEFHVIAPQKDKKTDIDEEYLISAEKRVEEITRLADRALGSQRRSEIREDQFKRLEKKAKGFSDECMRLTTRLVEADADRKEIDELNLETQVLREQLLKKEKTLKDSMEENKVLQRRVENLMNSESRGVDSQGQPTRRVSRIGGKNPKVVPPAPREDSEELQKAKRDHAQTKEQLFLVQARLNTATVELSRQRDAHQDSEADATRLRQLVEYLQEANDGLSKRNEEMLAESQKMGTLHKRERFLARQVEELEAQNQEINELKVKLRRAHEVERESRFETEDLKREIEILTDNSSQLGEVRAKIALLTREKKELSVELARRQATEDNHDRLNERGRFIPDHHAAETLGSMNDLKKENDELKSQLLRANKLITVDSKNLAQAALKQAECENELRSNLLKTANEKSEKLQQSIPSNTLKERGKDHFIGPSDHSNGGGTKREDKLTTLHGESVCHFEDGNNFIILPSGAKVPLDEQGGFLKLDRRPSS